MFKNFKFKSKDKDKMEEEDKKSRKEFLGSLLGEDKLKCTCKACKAAAKSDSPDWPCWRNNEEVMGRVVKDALFSGVKSSQPATREGSITGFNKVLGAEKSKPEEMSDLVYLSKIQPKEMSKLITTS